MERLFKDPQTLRQKRQWPLGPHIDHFAQQLSEQGYSQQCARRQLRLVAELSHWLCRRHLMVSDLTIAKMERFLRDRARRRPIKYGRGCGIEGVF